MFFFFFLTRAQTIRRGNLKRYEVSWCHEEVWQEGCNSVSELPYDSTIEKIASRPAMVYVFAVKSVSVGANCESDAGLTFDISSVLHDRPSSSSTGSIRPTG
jgi:hypothetical protein